MTNYNLGEFQKWLKIKGKENLMPSEGGFGKFYNYKIEKEQLLRGIIYENGISREPLPVEGELAQEFEVWKKKKKWLTNN